MGCTVDTVPLDAAYGPYVEVLFRAGRPEPQHPRIPQRAGGEEDEAEGRVHEERRGRADVPDPDIAGNLPQRPPWKAQGGFRSWAFLRQVLNGLRVQHHFPAIAVRPVAAFQLPRPDSGETQPSTRRTSLRPTA
jgi:hypothetical protein